MPVPEAGDATREVSEAVNARILSRILAFSGLPVALALGLFPLFYYLKARVLPCSAFLYGICCGGCLLLLAISFAQASEH